MTTYISCYASTFSATFPCSLTLLQSVQHTQAWLNIWIYHFQLLPLSSSYVSMEGVIDPRVFACFLLLHVCRYEIMLKCWQTDPDERPSFSTLVVLVSTDLEHQAGYLDFSFPTDAFSPQDSKEKCLALPCPTPPSHTPPSHTPPSPTLPSLTPPSPPLIVVTQADSDINWINFWSTWI